MSVFDILYLFLCILFSPLLLIKLFTDRRIRSNFFARFDTPARHPLIQEDRETIRVWVHAASIGEVRLALKLIKAWLKSNPRKSFIITTNTVESRELGRKESDNLVELAPLDFSLSVRRFIKRHKPRHLVLIETEIWPNMIRLMAGIGNVTIVNGRLSDRHFGRYTRLKGLLKGTLSRVELVLTRDETASERFLTLGIPAERIKCQGNLKYELPSTPDGKSIDAEKSATPVDLTQFLMVAGSIQPEELNIILPAWRTIKKHIKSFQLVIIPRHLNKKSEITEILIRHRVRFTFYSDADTADSKNGPVDIFIVDKFGVLNIWYYLADAVFVGGSLCDRGGQNMVEAVGFHKPVCIGPYATNFKEEVDLLTHVDGMKIIADATELSAFICFCHDRPEEAAAMADRGFKSIEKQVDALQATILSLENIYN